MKAHLKIHSGKTHSCPVCAKLFARPYHVKLHMKTHTKDKYLEEEPKVKIEKKANNTE